MSDEPRPPIEPAELDQALAERTLINRAVCEMIDTRKRLYALMNTLADATPDGGITRFSEISELVCDFHGDCETYLMKLILTFDPNVSPNQYDDLPWMNCPPRAVTVDGKIYMAMPDPGCCNAEEGGDYRVLKDGGHRMVFQIIDTAAITNLDSGPPLRGGR